MALLNRLLRLLEWLEQVMDLAEFLATSGGMAVLTCLLSYQGLLLMGCDSPSSAILASAIALTIHCGLNYPHR